MANLRSEVKKLEEDEVFERTVFRDSRFTNTEQPSSNDIDAILKSMMGNLPQPSTSHLSTRSMSPPTQPETNGHGQGRIFGDTPSESEVEAQLSTAVTGRRPPGSRSKGKTRR